MVGLGRRGFAESLAFVVLAAGMATGGFMTGVAGAGVSAPDLTITATSHPTTVSPPGATGMHRVTVKNALGRRTFTDIVVVHTLATGSQFDEGASCSNPSLDGITVVCGIGTLAPGASRALDILARTPTAVGPATSTARITSSSPRDDTRNNSAEVTTEVVDDPKLTSGFFKHGQHRLAEHVLTVPGGNGVVAAMSIEEPAQYCGSDCMFTGKPVKVDFPFPDPSYTYNDPLNPLTLHLDMGFLTPPCKGLGGTCDDLRYVKADGQGGVVPFCDGASGTNAGPAVALPSSPCKFHQFKDDEKRVHFMVALTSTDPTFF